METFRASLKRGLLALGRLALGSAMLLAVALVIGWARRAGL